LARLKRPIDMIKSDDFVAGREALSREASAWLRRLTSGAATGADLAALDLWREKSPKHDRAFAEAALLWEVAGDAAAMAVAENPGLAAMPDGRMLGRRGFMFGGFALAASVAAVGVVRPPLGLWPSLSEMKADFRTGRGEQRRIDVPGQVSLQLNTLTSVDVPPVAGAGTLIDLLAGEAAVVTEGYLSEVVVRAGAVRAGTVRGSFNVRKDGAAVCVTCLDGEVRVRTAQGSAVLSAGRQVAYEESGLTPVATADSQVVAAWREGLLVFREVPLIRLIEEVNRYRPGKIVLLDQRLAQRPVVATFRLDRIDDVVTFVHQVMNVPTRVLPGRIVLLG
jgi:transmembrane sensor